MPIAGHNQPDSVAQGHGRRSAGACTSPKVKLLAGMNLPPIDRLHYRCGDVQAGAAAPVIFPECKRWLQMKPSR